MPSVSIIVPSYNHAPFLQERWESIVNQTYQDYEIILLDDHSTDGSIEILKQFSTHPKVSHFVINEKNTGNPFIQWQRGIELAQGEFVWIAETDDKAHVLFLEKLVDKLLSDDRIGIAFCKSKGIDERGELIEKTSYLPDVNRWQSDFFLESKSQIANYFFLKNIIPNASAVVFRKRLLAQTSWKPDVFRYVGDWWAWYSILQFNAVYYFYEAYNSHRTHQQTTRVKSQTLPYILETYALRGLILKSSAIDKTTKRIVLNSLARQLVRHQGIVPLLFTLSGMRLCMSLTNIDPIVFFRISKIAASNVYHKMQ